MNEAMNRGFLLRLTAPFPCREPRSAILRGVVVDEHWCSPTALRLVPASTGRGAFAINAGARYPPGAACPAGIPPSDRFQPFPVLPAVRGPRPIQTASIPQKRQKASPGAGNDQQARTLLPVRQAG